MPTFTDLYRNGNSTSPRMDNVRPLKDGKGDIAIENREGVQWVEGGSGGISTFNRPRREKNWWELPEGSDIPDQLMVTADTSLPGHFLWEPDEDMTLADYKARLREIRPWNKINLLATEGRIVTAETTLSPAFAGLSTKVARLLLAAVEAIHQQHNSMMATASDDDASDLANDAALYALMIEQLRLRLSQPVGRAGPSR